MSQEQRSATRIQRPLPVVVQYAGTSVELVSRNYGLRGMYLETDDPLPLDVTCRVAVSVDEAEPLRAGAVVVRSEEGGMALSFRDMSIEDFRRLQEALVADADDPAVFEDEFGGHHGLVDR